MKRIVLLVAVSAGLVFLAACNKKAPESDQQTIEGSEQYAFKPEDASTTLTKAEEGLVVASNGFGFSIASKIEDKSFVFSPLSATILLGMLEEGAEGETAAEISRVLGFGDAGRQQINSFCRNMMVIADKGEDAVVKMANALMLNKNAALKDSYLRVSKEYYDAEAVNLDFSSSKSLDYINGWAREKTNGLIPNLLDRINGGAFAYVMNALYFKAAWHKMFYGSTPDCDFTTVDGKVEKVSMLRQREDFNYVETAEARAVNMLYKGGSYQMTVILPAEGKTTTELLGLLGDGLFDRIRQSWKGTDVRLSIPEFEVSSEIGLKDILKAMGMKKAFDGADFSRMTDADIYVEDIFQKAKINVDEKGTEAAAVSVAELPVSSPGTPEVIPDPVIFTADRPFVYIVSERSTGAILFVGVFGGK